MREGIGVSITRCALKRASFAAAFSVAFAVSSRADAGLSWQSFTMGSPPKVTHANTSLPIGGNYYMLLYPDPFNTANLGFFILGEGTNNGNKQAIQGYCAGNAASCNYTWNSSGTGYFQGISYNSQSSTFYGWTDNADSNHLYEGSLTSPGSPIGTGYAQATYLDDGYDNGYLLSLETGTSCGTGSGNPHGLCIGEYVDFWGTWSSSAGVAQLTQDAVTTLDNTLYAVDGAGKPWKFDESSHTWSAFANQTFCDNDGTSPLVIAQLVVNNGIAYALEYTPGGTTGSNVYYYATEPLSDCWTPVAETPGLRGPQWALSLTALSTSAYEASNGVLWATDILGSIWYLE